MGALNEIPEMTDPLGKHWHQPRDIRQAPMDDKLVLLTPAQFEALPEYSTSMPSGAYEGKCWKRAQYELDPKGGWVSTGVWWLGWYGPDKPGYVSNNWRTIEVVT